MGDREEYSMYFKESQRGEAGPGGRTEHDFFFMLPAWLSMPIIQKWVEESLLGLILNFCNGFQRTVSPSPHSDAELFADNREGFL